MIALLQILSLLYVSAPHPELRFLFPAPSLEEPSPLRSSQCCGSLCSGTVSPGAESHHPPKRKSYGRGEVTS